MSQATNIEAIFWMCASTFLLGYIGGETIRLVQEIRRYRKARRDLGVWR